MKLHTHILNGDMLKQQFPESLQGEKIVMRECLVDGSVKGETLEEFYKVRTKFLDDHYGGCSEEEYASKSVVEFQKVQAIDEAHEINLWFEDDLFCQVNLWFIAYLLQRSGKAQHIYLVRPPKHTRYGFGGLDARELLTLYKDRILLTEISFFARLWEYYQADNFSELTKMAIDWEAKYPFVRAAVQVHLDRIPKKGNLGRPKESLLQISKDLDTTEFAPVFQEFCKREPVYGFGDMQVLRLFKEVQGNLG